MPSRTMVSLVIEANDRLANVRERTDANPTVEYSSAS